MNLIEVLSQRAEAIPQGPHSVGLKAVVQHAQAAVRHLERGQKERDETAFTDAVYRTNQAFEGSLKEAYRVLASHHGAADAQRGRAQHGRWTPWARLCRPRDKRRHQLEYDIEPGFSADMADLYFVSNRDGKFAIERAHRS
jgi:hypothetical protein